MLSVVMECCYAECHYAECRNAECCCAECRYAECHYAECGGATLDSNKKTLKTLQLISAATKFLAAFRLSVCGSNLWFPHFDFDLG